MTRYIMPVIFVALMLLTLAFVHRAKSQDGGTNALVVTTCGTMPQPYGVGSTKQWTVNTNGQVCT